MGDGANSRRAKPRISVRFSAAYRGWNLNGSGTVRNISESGALIDPAEPLLVSGGRIKIRFSFFEDSLPVEVAAVVARETETGFAVRFTGLDQRLRAVLNMAIARARKASDENAEAGDGPTFAEVDIFDADDDDITLLGNKKKGR